MLGFFKELNTPQAPMGLALYLTLVIKAAEPV